VRWGTFSILAERNRYLLWEELDAAAKDPKTPLQKKYGAYYAACMNTDLIDKKGVEPIKPALDQIAGLQDTKRMASW
jgi:putative endopeptidase